VETSLHSKFLKKLLLYYFTLRDLTPRQIFFQVLRLKRSRSISDVKDKFTVRDFIGYFSATPSLFEDRIFKEKGVLYFKSLNQTAPVDEAFWDDKNYSDLQRFHRHYFEVLRSDNSFNLDFLEHWFESRNKYKQQGSSYIESRRVVNLIFFYLRTSKLSEAYLSEVYSRFIFISKNIEFHLGGNHLITNLKALLIGACFFESKSSDKIFDRASKILFEELENQILVDGFHEERTPFYHFIVLQDLSDLLHIIDFFNQQR
jgi:hypothetical protein